MIESLKQTVTYQYTILKYFSTSIEQVSTPNMNPQKETCSHAASINGSIILCTLGGEYARRLQALSIALSC